MNIIGNGRTGQDFFTEFCASLPAEKSCLSVGQN